MKIHRVRVQAPGSRLAREEQLAWKLAGVAVDPVPVEAPVGAMIINRMTENAGVAAAALNRRPVVNARAMALAHPLSGGPPPRSGGAGVFGVPAERRVDAAWAAWANGTAVRELDFHDTFLAADYAHPADSIPPLLAVAQHTGRGGADLIRGIAAAYEVQVNLVKAICLHAHGIDHIAHLGPAVAAGLGALLGLDQATTTGAIEQALHVTCTTRQSRKGEISSWKAYAPAHAGKLAIEAVDRAMRGEGAPTPIYEGEDSVIARLLDGPDASYEVPLPEPGEAKTAILETYTKAHSAEYQAQALIDLAFSLHARMGGRLPGRGGARVPDWEAVRSITIETSHHTHNVIGSGSNDPQKYDPMASRETLDHSIMYIFAVALQDGVWHHEASYAPARARRPDTVRLWQKIRTSEDAGWTARYHGRDPDERAFGGRAVIELADGTTISGELAVADAHPRGAKAFARADYVAKFEALAAALVPAVERARFLAIVQNLPDAAPGDLAGLNLAVPADRLAVGERGGIF